MDVDFDDREAVPPSPADGMEVDGSPTIQTTQVFDTKHHNAGDAIMEGEDGVMEVDGEMGEYEHDAEEQEEYYGGDDGYNDGDEVMDEDVVGESVSVDGEETDAGNGIGSTETGGAESTSAAGPMASVKDTAVHAEPRAEVAPQTVSRASPARAGASDSTTEPNTADAEVPAGAKHTDDGAENINRAVGQPETELQAITNEETAEPNAEGPPQTAGAENVHKADDTETAAVAEAEAIEDADADAEAEAEADGDIEAEEDTDLDDLLTIHTLPPILIHPPAGPPKLLFWTPEDHEVFNDIIEAELDILLEGKHEGYGNASLEVLFAQIRQEIADYVEVGQGVEMILEERALGIKMGEHDKHLSTITLLDLLQVHHSCELPLPVHLYLTFEPSRFFDRFEAIRKELVVRAERRKLGMTEQDEYDIGEGDVRDDDGYESGEDDGEGEGEGEGGEGDAVEGEAIQGEEQAGEQEYTDADEQGEGMYNEDGQGDETGDNENGQTPVGEMQPEGITATDASRGAAGQEAQPAAAASAGQNDITPTADDAAALVADDKGQHGGGAISISAQPIDPTAPIVAINGEQPTNMDQPPLDAVELQYLNEAKQAEAAVPETTLEDIEGAIEAMPHPETAVVPDDVDIPEVPLGDIEKGQIEGAIPADAPSVLAPEEVDALAETAPHPEATLADDEVAEDEETAEAVEDGDVAIEEGDDAEYVEEGEEEVEEEGDEYGVDAIVEQAEEDIKEAQEDRPAEEVEDPLEMSVRDGLVSAEAAKAVDPDFVDPNDMQGPEAIDPEAAADDLNPYETYEDEGVEDGAVGDEDEGYYGDEVGAEDNGDDGADVQTAVSAKRPLLDEEEEDEGVDVDVHEDKRSRA